MYDFPQSSNRDDEFHLREPAMQPKNMWDSRYSVQFWWLSGWEKGNKGGWWFQVADPGSLPSLPSAPRSLQPQSFRICCGRIWFPQGTPKLLSLQCITIFYKLFPLLLKKIKFRVECIAGFLFDLSSFNSFSLVCFSRLKSWIFDSCHGTRPFPQCLKSVSATNALVTCELRLCTPCFTNQGDSCFIYCLFVRLFFLLSFVFFWLFFSSFFCAYFIPKIKKALEGYLDSFSL